MMTRVLIVTTLFLTFSACERPADRTDATAAQFRRLLDEEWEYRLQDSPSFASGLGDRRYNDRWRDLSITAFERRRQHDVSLLERLIEINSEQLPDEEQLNYLLFREQLDNRIAGHRFQGYLLPLNQRGGIQTADQLADSLTFQTAGDYQDWLARLHAFPAYMDQTIALMRVGIQSNMLHPKVIMDRIPGQIAVQVVEDPGDSPFFKPFIEPNGQVAPDRMRQFQWEAKAAIETEVVPAFRKLGDFLRQEYIPACYDRAGIWQQKNGPEHYAHLVKTFTTTSFTPDEIHRIGLAEVARIRSEMERMITKVGFQGSFAEFLHCLRSDSRFYFNNPEELLDAYRILTKRIDPALVKLFGRLPRIPYGVEPIPKAIAPDTTTAYYRPPAADGSRAGTYFVNLYRPEVRPKYEIEALTIHEAVPGHHLQLALAQELGELPAFRRYGGYTAFVEGWALYAESLGEELGLYRDPYSKFGQLTYEMWRAVRLVVDTGMHHQRWTRQQAIDFFGEHAAKTEHDIVNEVDRYIAWPGQALAYKIGELKLKALKAHAKKQLGDVFDIRAFHDVVLGVGSLPLNVLEERVMAWVEEVRDSPRQD